jgi:hypothetical protein
VPGFCGDATIAFGTTFGQFLVSDWTVRQLWLPLVNLTGLPVPSVQAIQLLMFDLTMNSPVEVSIAQRSKGIALKSSSPDGVVKDNKVCAVTLRAVVMSHQTRNGCRLAG